MKECVVCNAPLKATSNICAACDTDLSIIIEMGQLPISLKRLASEAERTGDYAQAQTYYHLALDMEPEDKDLFRNLEAVKHKQTSRPAGRPLFYIIVIFFALTIGWTGHMIKRSYFDKNLDGSAIGGPVVASIKHFGLEDNTRNAAPDKTANKKGSHESKRPSPLVSGARPHLDKVKTIARKLILELPKGIQVKTQDGGLFLEGKVSYPWEKIAVEDRVRILESSFVDMTGVAVEHPNAFRYQVKQGDSLYSLSKRFLGRSALWPVLYEANRRVITNPDKLSIGQTIVVYTKIP